MAVVREFNQFLAILFKGFLLRKRHYIVTIFELIIPVLIASLALIICHYQAPYSQKDDSSNFKNTTYYDAESPFKTYSVWSQTWFLYAPNTDASRSLIKEAMTIWDRKVGRHGEVHEHGFDTEQDVEDFAVTLMANSSVNIAGAIFSNLDSKLKVLPKSLVYKLRCADVGGYDTFNTGSKFRYQIGPRGFEEYTDTVFLSWQAAIEQAFIRLKSNKKDFEVMMQRFPYPSYKLTTGTSAFVELCQQLIVNGYVVFICVLVKRLAEEKANHSKELLKMMGMTNCTYWTSVFLNVFVPGLVTVFIIAVLYKIPIPSAHEIPFDLLNNTDVITSSSVLRHSDFFLFFVLLLLFITSTILFCMALSTFVTKPVMAVVLVLIVYSISHSVLFSFLFAPMRDYSFSDVDIHAKLAVCLLPTGSVQVIFRMLGALEARGDGALWGNMTDFVISPDINLAMVMAMMLVSILLYTIIIWYVDAVWPWQDGIPKPVYFPFTKSYWCGSAEESDEHKSRANENNAYFEPEPEGKTPGIVVRNLRKTFRVGFVSKAAVDDVSLNIYSGQITALLGQNGAGKTTTINMLTGLFMPNSGSASINGYDIRTQTVQARRNFGICPQQNILYDTLTVLEHLKIYAVLKGVPWKQMSVEASKVVSLLKLQDKTNTISKDLSGGMKRKLSLGIALIGESKVLFLDEPTSGMDPENRRALWDILLEIRSDKTIVLTTHYMEEADILGDRIAIMASGKLRCCGSPMFLKKKFGTGYRLHVAKDADCKVDAVTQALQVFVPETEVENNSETGITYSFAGTTATGTVFGDMFRKLEERKLELGVATFGLTVSTMDDVFLKVTSTETHDLEKEINGVTQNAASIEDLTESSFLIENSRKSSGFNMWLGCVWCLIVKRFCYSKRHWGIWASLLVVPFLFLCLFTGTLQGLFSLAGSTPPPLSLDLKEVYGETEGFYVSSDDAGFLTENYAPLLDMNGVNVQPVPDALEYILKIGTADLNRYLKKLEVGGSQNSVYTAWYNGEPFHVLPMSLNLMHTALLRNFTGDRSASLRVTNAPFPTRGSLTMLQPVVRQSLIRFMTCSFIPFALAFMAASYVIVPIHERTSKAKLLQLMTGIGTWTYWLGMFLWDMSLHAVAVVLLLLPFAFFNSYVFFPHPEAIGTVMMMLLLYGWCSIPLAYLLSCIFKKPATGFNVIVCINGIIGLVVAIILTAFSPTGEMPWKVETSVWAFRLFPSFSVTWGLSMALSTSFDNAFCEGIPKNILKTSCENPIRGMPIMRCCKNICGPSCFNATHPMSWGTKGCGADALFLFIDGIIFFAILVFVESQFFSKISSRFTFRLPWKKFVTPAATDPEYVADADVLKESQRVEELGPLAAVQEAMVVIGLTKNYVNLCAVDKLSFSVHNEECFGLLGVNGAGKTSTFKMLTGDIAPTRGNAYIGEFSIQTHLKKFQSYLGYCPQYDAVLDRLTGREMLRLFAKLRGLTTESSEICVRELIKCVDLDEHADKQTRYYSGGNKRKLSLAMAVIGAPAVILLDEPTSGVDPVSRRKIWRVLEKVREVAGAAIILCTHSMEECETLCSRLAIMVNGQFRCLGAVQSLKSKFGQGYSVVIKLKRERMGDLHLVGNLKGHFTSAFPSASLKDDHQGMLQYHITDTSIPWSHLFSVMEEMKQNFDLEDYLISGTTLEQIFLAFARSQRISAEHI